MTDPAQVFTKEKLAQLFPPGRADAFFDALFGDAAEGAYDITLHFAGQQGDELHFELRLSQRPGKCLACNLTYGLPEVFSRHPVIDLDGVARAAAEAMGRPLAGWRLGRTTEISRELHMIPLVVQLG